MGRGPSAFVAVVLLRMIVVPVILPLVAVVCVARHDGVS